MKISIIGSSGWVGKEMYKLFEPYNPVLYDEPLNVGTRENVNQTDVAFICVPTPMKDNGECDTSIVESVIEWIECPLIILRSTVSPGTTKRLSDKYGKLIVMNPEYIGETVDHPLMNSKERKFLILGGERIATQKAVEVYQFVYNSSVHIYQCTGTEAELIKYCENSFIGTYVTFCNEFYNICQNFGVDWNIVREGFLLDPRMTPYWTFVYPHKRGFSGKCIPKDMNAIVAESEKNGYMPLFLKHVLDNNKRLQS